MEQLWFDEPAKEWKKAIPIGNGRLGAMVHGGICQEKLQMNQDSLYYGGPADRINPNAKEHLPEVRKCILSGRIREAEELLKRCFSGIPVRHRVYQTLGNVSLTYRINGWTKKPSICPAPWERAAWSGSWGFGQCVMEERQGFWESG